MPRSAALYDSPGTLALDWSGLYDEHAPRLHRIAARRVGTDNASDVVQEIFVRAYRNRHSLDPARPIGAWLSTIALRASTDALRRQSARPEVPVAEEGETAALGGEVDDEFENLVRREGIKAAFDTLPERQQQVFRMLAIDGLSQEEAAREVGISTDAVKSLFARARHTFKESYQAFSERMGVFGGAAVGGTLWKLRSRLQRVQGLVTEHVGAFSMAAATVTVVAIATVPTTRAVPTMAEESRNKAPAEGGEEQFAVPTSAGKTAIAEQVQPAAATSPSSATAVDPPAVVPPPPSDEEISASAAVSSDDSTSTVTVGVEKKDGSGSSSSSTWLIVECEAGYSTTAMCEALNSTTGQ